MECPAETLEQLVELQAVDFKILNLKRTFDTLPQRQAILKLRQQLADVQERKAGITVLVDKAQAVVDGIDAEAKMVSGKKAAVEAMMMDKATGYRDVEAHQKELASFAKRLETLDHKRGTAVVELDKVKAAEAKIDAALTALSSAENLQVESFKQQGTDLKTQIAQTEAERASMVGAIDAAMLAVYEKAAARCGGVALAHLNGTSCSVCRATIDQAHLNQMKHEAPLSTCPQCRRLMIM